MESSRKKLWGKGTEMDNGYTHTPLLPGYCDLSVFAESSGSLIYTVSHLNNPQANPSWTEISKVMS